MSRAEKAPEDSAANGDDDHSGHEPDRKGTGIRHPKVMRPDAVAVGIEWGTD